VRNPKPKTATDQDNAAELQAGKRRITLSSTINNQSEKLKESTDERKARNPTRKKGTRTRSRATRRQKLHQEKEKEGQRGLDLVGTPGFQWGNITEVGIVEQGNRKKRVKRLVGGKNTKRKKKTFEFTSPKRRASSGAPWGGDDPKTKQKERGPTEGQDMEKLAGGRRDASRGL